MRFAIPAQRFGAPIRWFHVAFWRLCRLLRPWFRIETEGMEKLPKTGPAVVVGPHFSYSDSWPYFYTALPRPPRFIASAFVVVHSAVQSWVMYVGGVVPAWRHRRDAWVLRRVLRLLARGEVVAFFPEGGRTWAGVPTAPMMPAAKLLARLKVPVFLASVEGSYDVWPRWDPKIRRLPVKVKLTGPITLPPVEGAREDQHWWREVYRSGGTLDAAAAQESLRRQFIEISHGEAARLDLTRKGRLQWLPRLLCFCSECSAPRTAIVGEKLTCAACGLAWAASGRGKLSKNGVDSAELVSAMFEKMVDRLQDSAATGLVVEESIDVRVMKDDVMAKEAFPGTARLTPDGVVIASNGREWRTSVEALAHAGSEGSDVLVVPLGGGESLVLTSRLAALRLVLGARALLKLPLSTLVP